jgi:hypothetical protein
MSIDPDDLNHILIHETAFRNRNMVANGTPQIFVLCCSAGKLSTQWTGTIQASGRIVMTIHAPLRPAGTRTCMGVDEVWSQVKKLSNMCLVDAVQEIYNGAAVTLPASVVPDIPSYNPIVGKPVLRAYIEVSMRRVNALAEQCYHRKSGLFIGYQSQVGQIAARRNANKINILRSFGVRVSDGIYDRDLDGSNEWRISYYLSANGCVAISWVRCSVILQDQSVRQVVKVMSKGRTDDPARAAMFRRAFAEFWQDLSEANQRYAEGASRTSRIYLTTIPNSASSLCILAFIWSFASFKSSFSSISF